MVNLREQELSLQLCIIAIMQKEELSDSRNRQAAGNQGEQNEGQIWQRVAGAGWWGGGGDGSEGVASFGVDLIS
jgi:hypothetical protein